MRKLITTQRIKAGAVFANQALASFSTFAIMFFLVRQIGVAEYGVYAMLFLIATSLMGIVNAIFAQPLVSIAGRLSPRRSRQLVHAASWGQISIVVVIFVLSAICAIVTPYGAEALALSFMTAAVVLAEFFRRIYFLRGYVLQIWVFDAIRYGIMIISFYAISRIGHLNTGLTYAYAFSSAYLIGVAAFSFGPLIRMWRNFEFLRVAALCRRLLKSGKWLGFSMALQFLNGQAVILLGFGLLGAYEAGLVRVSQSIVGLTSPILQALEYTVPKWLGEKARRFRTKEALRRYTVFGAGLFAALVLIYSAIGLPAQFYLTLIGIEDDPNAVLALRGFCLIYIANALFLLLRFELRLLEKTRSVFYATGFSAAIAVALAWPSVSYFGISGIVANILISRLASIGLLMVFAIRERKNVIV